MPEELAGDVDGFTIDRDGGAAGDEESQSGGCDDDVRVEGVAGGELDTGFSDGRDGVGFHVGVAGVQGAEEVAVRADAETLIPGVVAGFEMRGVGDMSGELAGNGETEKEARDCREGPAEEEEEVAADEPGNALDAARDGGG